MSQDGSFSFHYLKGWQVHEDESVIVLEWEDSEEEVYFFFLPYEHTWSAKEYADFMLSALKAENPGLEASGWQSDTESGTVLFNLVYGSGDHAYDALGLGIKGGNSRQARWVHYFAPSENYSQSLGAYILQRFLGSIAAGSTSTPPDEGQISSLGDDEKREARILRNESSLSKEVLLGGSEVSCTEATLHRSSRALKVEHSQLRTVAKLQFLQNHAEVIAHCAFAEVERFRDFSIT